MARFPTGVVIVGGSAAGLSAADGLREGGWTGPITVLDEHLEPGFDRPMLSKGLVADASAVPRDLRTPEHLAAQEITVLAGHRATGLDIDRRAVVTSYGEAIPWEHVVVATGCGARRLRTTSGHELPVLRTRADLTRAQRDLAGAQTLAIIGGGYIGLEVASSLAAAEVEVTVLCPNPLPLVRDVGPAVAAWLRDLHRQRGVTLQLGAAVTAVTEDGPGFRIVMDDGSERRADAVLAGIGAEPATDWLVGSGLTLGGGVVVDEFGRSDVEGVWAAGDVASTRDATSGRARRFEHWTHAVEQGRRVGLNIAGGEPVAFDAVPYVWTDQHGHTLHLLGERRPHDADVVVEGDLAAGDFVVAHGSDDELHAVTICGRVTALRGFRTLLRTGARLTDVLTPTT